MLRLLHAAMLAFPTMAAAVGPPVVPEVTVTAPKPPDPRELAGDSVPTFIKNHGKPAILSGQLGRWATEVCPRTEGLATAFNSFVSARIAAIAASVGAPHRWAAQCRPNVAIYFTADPQAMLDEVAKHAPQLLGFHYPHQVKRLATVNRPIQAWYVTAIRGISGEDTVDDIWGSLPPGRLGSRLTLGRSSLIVFVLVVADTRKLNDFSVGSISDYISTHTLAPRLIGWVWTTTQHHRFNVAGLWIELHIDCDDGGRHGLFASLVFARYGTTAFSAARGYSKQNDARV